MKLRLSIRVHHFLLLILFSELLGCSGKDNKQPTFLDRQKDVNVPRMAQVADEDAELEKFHRPRTWQDTGGFTPYEDYFPNEILVLFANEIELPADFQAGGSRGDVQPYNPNSVLYQNKSHANFARYIAEKYDLELLASQEAYVAGFNFAGFRLPPNVNSEELMQTLLDENPQNIALVEYNGIRKAYYTANDQYLSRQWHHMNINSYGAWDYGKGNEDTWIAVIDTGVDLDHPDLVGNVLPFWELWPNEDFDLVERDSLPDDDSGHGSHVAGICSAVGDNFIGVAGIAYRSKILPISVLGYGLPLYAGFIGASARAMILATELGVDVINMSYGWKFPSMVEWQAAKYAFEHQVILIAAAGNENHNAQISFPAGIPYVIAVGALDRSDARATYSNFGIWVDIAAPGGDYGGSYAIYSTVLDHYDYMMGTSMASPMVSGAGALVKSVRAGFTNSQYRAFLESSGDKLAPEDWGGNDLIRELNVREALFRSVPSAPEVVIDTPPDRSNVQGVTPVMITASSSASLSAINLYVNGFLAESGSGVFTVDFSDYLDSQVTLTVEVIDKNYQHAFSEIKVFVTEPRTFTAPYSTGFDSSQEIEGWTVQDFGGPNTWHLTPDADGQVIRYDISDQEVDWLVSPNIDTGGATTGNILMKANWDGNLDSIICLWLYPDDPVFYENLFPINAFQPVEGYPEYLRRVISFPPGRTLKFAFIPKWSGNQAGSFFEIDELSVSVPTGLSEISILTPKDGEHVRELMDIEAEVQADGNLDRVEFWVNSERVATLSGPPYAVTVNTRHYPNGNGWVGVSAYSSDFLEEQGLPELEDPGMAVHQIYIENFGVDFIDPLYGFYNDRFVISGWGFDSRRIDAELRVAFTAESGEVDAEVTKWRGEEISGCVPVGSKSGPIRVYIDGAFVESTENFTLVNPFSGLGFTIVDAPENMLLPKSFTVVTAPEPDLESLKLEVVGYSERSWTLPTRYNENPQYFQVDVSGLRTGKYILRLTGCYKDYQESVETTFYLNPLPGDFNGDGVVNELDVIILNDFLRENGPVGENESTFLPYMDVNGDSWIDEQDSAFVGYHYGDSI